MLGDVAALTADVETRLADLGFELVDIRVGGTTARVRIQIRIDWRDTVPERGITVDDCASASRALERGFEEAGRLGDRYVLEVSSPGIERPVRRREHWERFVGRDVQVRLRGRGRIRATITRVVEGRDDVVLKPVGGGDEIVVAIADARDATLVVDWNAERL
ncbi:MAG: ribosome maturation factor RimP [Gemmatimonadetes bacterium]|nr:ribosome maturation factor RimP [Gemmatimonadota bacterium]